MAGRLQPAQPGWCGCNAQGGAGQHLQAWQARLPAFLICWTVPGQERRCSVLAPEMLRRHCSAGCWHSLASSCNRSRCLAYCSRTKPLPNTKCYSAGAKLLFGGKEIQNHTIPKVYGAIEPTAVFVPLKEVLKDEETFNLITTEVFGPVQVWLALCVAEIVVLGQLLGQL